MSSIILQNILFLRNYFIHGAGDQFQFIFQPILDGMMLLCDVPLILYPFDKIFFVNITVQKIEDHLKEIEKKEEFSKNNA